MKENTKKQKTSSTQAQSQIKTAPVCAQPGQEELSDVQNPVAGTSINLLDVLDAFPFYVLLVDDRHYIVEANKAVYSQLGIKREQILGKYCPLIIHGTRELFEGCPLEEAAEKNAAVEKELFDKRTGRWVVSAIYPTGALTRTGNRIFLHMVIDVTDRKYAQEQLKVSHEQLRSLAAHLETVREEEKRQIARDLHDETSQVLSSLYAHLEAAIATLPKDADKTREILKKAQTLSTAILDDIHKIVHDLRPAVLDRLGLIAAVNSLVDNYLRIIGLKVSIKTTGKVKRLPNSMEISLFRVIQESFNNIVKHAHAKNVRVNIGFKKDKMEVKIKDDGIGFNPQEAISVKGKPRGLGLLGMRERVELMNGSLSINSTPGEGTELSILIPLKGEVKNG